MLNTAANAYNKISKEAMSPRQLEAAILNRAAAMLKSVQENWDDQDHVKRLDEALRYNQKLWSVFQTELIAPENPLPKKLREDILSISLFIDRRSFDLMAYPDRDKITALITINQNIAAGLNTIPQKETSSA